VAAATPSAAAGDVLPAAEPQSLAIPSPAASPSNRQAVQPAPMLTSFHVILTAFPSL
jgi:hypothetical protein